MLDVPQRVKEFHELIAGLFGEVSVALTQFRIYARIQEFSSMVSELIENVHKVMISFVDVCALSIELQSGSSWKSFRRDAKWVLFNNDSGVKQALEDFRSRVHKQGQWRGH